MHIFLKGKLLDDRKIISSFITYRFKCLTLLKSFRSHKRWINEPRTFINYLYCVFMFIYTCFLDVCQWVCCIQTEVAFSIVHSASVVSLAYQWSKMTVTKKKKSNRCSNRWNVPFKWLSPSPDEPIGEEEENIEGRKWLFCLDFSVVLQLPTATHLVSKLCS